MLLSLDDFVFSLETLAYQELQRQVSWKHPSTSRIGARNASQFAGPGDDTITLTGVLATEINSLQSLDDLYAMGDVGDYYVMVDGAGYVYGAFTIESISEQQSYHLEDGTPRKINFTITLKRVADDLMQENQEQNQDQNQDHATTTA